MKGEKVMNESLGCWWWDTLCCPLGSAWPLGSLFIKPSLPKTASAMCS